MRTLPTAFILLTMTLWMGAAHADDTPNGRIALEELTESLDTLTQLVGQLDSRRQGRKMMKQISDARRSLATLRRALRQRRRPKRVVRPVVRPVIRPIVRRPPVASPAAFSKLFDSMEEGAFAKDKLRALRMGLAHQLITSDQAARLVETLAFGSDKIEALVMIHPRLADPNNFFTLMKLLVHANDRDKLAKRLGL